MQTAPSLINNFCKKTGPEIQGRFDINGLSRFICQDESG